MRHTPTSIKRLYLHINFEHHENQTAPRRAAAVAHTRIRRRTDALRRRRHPHHNRQGSAYSPTVRPHRHIGIRRPRKDRGLLRILDGDRHRIPHRQQNHPRPMEHLRTQRGGKHVGRDAKGARPLHNARRTVGLRGRRAPPERAARTTSTKRRS